jgi:PAS domain S-box-containing protein
MSDKSNIIAIRGKGNFVRLFIERKQEILEKVTEMLVSKAFENRYTLHPRQLGEVATNEVETFLKFLSTGDREMIIEHGRKRALEGLGERSLLAVHRILRDFAFEITKDQPIDFVRCGAKGIDGYSEEYLYGYMTERTNQTLKDQEELRRALSTALKRQRHELHIKNHAIQTSINGIMITDLDCEITYVNPAFMKMWGYDREEEILKKDCLPFLGIKDFCVLLKSPGEPKGGQNEFTAVRKNGSTFEIVVSASRIHDEKLQPVGIMAYFIDVTERKRLEGRLQRAHKMEAIGTLAGGVAHDLNNILSGLVGYPDLILLDLAEDDPLRGPILTIKESGLKAGAIVEDLLTLARRGVAVTDALNLSHVVTDYLMSPEYKKLRDLHPEFQLETDLEPDLLNILGSPVHLSKTVMNLISNAAESMPNGGKILVSAENRYIDRPVGGYDHVEEGDYVVLSVSDVGVGIPTKEIERIFEPFYTRKIMGRSGTGLGMAVVWGTVKDHKGYIDVKSREGEGTTFNLYFPVTRKEATTDQSSVSLEEYMAKGESILVVDDVKAQQEIAARILIRLGYFVASVSSGEEAVEYLKNNSADLLVLDMIMTPGIDGLETYRRVLKIRPGQRAVIVSGYSETERVKGAQRLGAGPYIKKPYLLEKIGQAVRAELDK